MEKKVWINRKVGERTSLELSSKSYDNTIG